MFSKPHTLYVDLSLNGICVALAEGVHSTHAKIISTRTAHFHDNHKHYHKALVTLRTRLQEIIHILITEYNIKHYELVFFVHAPLCTSRTVQHTYAFKKETTITKLHIQEVLESARKSAAEKNTEGLESVFREYITSIALNGYQTESPVGKTALEATCTIAQEALAGGVMKTIISPITQGVVSYTIYNYAQLVGMMLAQVNSEKNARFGLVEITPDTCEITLYAKKTLEKHILIPIGSRRILDSVGDHLHLTYEFIHSLLKASGQKSLNTEVQQSIDALIAKSAQIFQQTIQSHHEDIALFPPRMFIVSERGTEQFWTAVLSKALESAKLVIEEISVDVKKLEYTLAHDPATVVAIYAHMTSDTSSIPKSIK